MPSPYHHKTAACAEHKAGRDCPVHGPAQPAQATERPGVAVLVPVGVLALLVEGFGYAGDGGPDPFRREERAIVDEWLDGMNLEATLAAERQRQDGPANRDNANLSYTRSSRTLADFTAFHATVIAGALQRAEVRD